MKLISCMDNSFLQNYSPPSLVNVLTIVKSCTCMLLNDNHLNKRQEYEMKVIGTGVFIQFKNYYFLISAAHVFDYFNERNIQTKIPLEAGSNMLFEPGGLLSVNNTTKRKKDFVDIGFLLLDLESVLEISKHYTFLKEDNLAPNHNFINYEFYSFFGYPTTLSKTKYDKSSFHSVPFLHLTTPLQEEKYNKYERQPRYNVITSYDRKNSLNIKTKTVSNGPDLFGISGCGLWFIDPSDIMKGYVEPKLTAIMTDWPETDRTNVIGTRIYIVIQSIEIVLETIHDSEKVHYFHTNTK